MADAVEKPRSKAHSKGFMAANLVVVAGFLGVLVLFAFTALELCYSDPSSPRALAFAIALYSYLALFGMAPESRQLNQSLYKWITAGDF